MQSRLPRNAPAWLDRLSRWLEPFEACFGHVAQRGAFRRYLLGLLSDSRRKSMSAMLERVHDPGTYQAFQHFISHAPWDVARVWRQLRAVIPDRDGVLILDATSFPKQGPHSVGVARQYCGTLGKVANCQVAVTAALWTGVRAWMLGASLYLPEAWLTPEARQRAKIPSPVRFQEKWRLALTLVRQIRAAGFHVTAVLGDADFGDNAMLRRALHRWRLPYALGISSTLTVFRGTPTVAVPRRKRPNAPPPTRLQVTDGSRPEQVRAIVAQLPARAWRRVSWRNGTNRPWAADFAALRVTPAHDWRARRLAPEVWLRLQAWTARRRHYEQALEVNLRDLSERLQRGAYRAKPVRRVYIPKADGRQRPLGVPVLEDKIVQRATVEVLNTIYETDFLGFSYGFRPGRSQHQALDALYVGVLTQKVSWVLDVDIRAFFDTIDHGWLCKFLEHRIADRRIVRLIHKWLNAGVLDEGTHTRVEEGTPQGGSVSPLLANIYLHYVFDLWVHAWRRKQARGNVIVVRFADDIVLGFEAKSDAERFRADLAERFAKFHLELHPEKTHLLEFGAYAAERRARRGLGKPETFNFLGFTHICGKKRGSGHATVLRHTMRPRLQAKLREVKAELRQRLHRPLCEQGAWLRRVVGGHIRYYGVPSNGAAIYTFRFQVARLWFRTLRHRSQRDCTSWTRMRRHIDRWLPPAQVCHPYPFHRAWRHYLRREPDAGNPHVRFCGGGAQ